MLLFFSMVILISIIFIIIIFSDIRFIIECLELSNSNKSLAPEYKGKICLYFMGKVKLLSIKFNKDKIKRFIKKDFIKRRIDKIKNKNIDQKKIQNEYKRRVIKLIKQNTKIKKLNLKIYIDTENVMLTSYLVAIVSSIIPNFIRNNIENFDNNNHKFEILPLYKNQNYLYLKLNGIFSIKLVHIINMFKLMGGIKNERSSYRRLNVNCYGKY